MSEFMKNVELLAPAGNFKSLKAAVLNGANAVYVGLKGFSARSFAENFTIEELREAVLFCHQRDVKVHVAVNTLVDDRELVYAVEVIKQINQCGADAVIIQDIGLYNYISKVIPDLEFHASTQMTVHNADGAKFLENLGFSRVVLSRELSSDDISYIKNKTDIELEVFVHGAICICYSGQCLMSSFIGGRSGNRGKCAQPCRLFYSAYKYKNKTLLSPKDMSLIHHIDELVNKCGVSSLKIEGRMKGEAYVGTVTSIYSKYLKSFKKINNADDYALHNIFNRGGYTDGYFTGSTGKNMFCFNKPENPYLDVCYNVNIDDVKSKSIMFEYNFTIGSPAILYLKYNNITVEAVSDGIVENSKSLPLTHENICRQLLKLGKTVFDISGISGFVSDNAFLSVGEINKLRRRVINKFLIDVKEEFSYSLPANTHKGKFEGFTVQVTKPQQLEALKNYNFKRAYIPIGIVKDIDISDIKFEVYILMPRIIKDSEKQAYINMINSIRLDDFDGFAVGNFSQIEYLKNYNKPIHGDFGLNIFNSSSCEFYSKYINSLTMSPELSIAKISHINKYIPSEILIYGKTPLMITENCVGKVINECDCCNIEKGLKITDRMHESFSIIKEGLFCKSAILNSKPVFVADKLSDLNRTNCEFYRLLFTDETFDDCIKIADMHFNKSDNKIKNFTRGYFYRNIE